MANCGLIILDPKTLLYSNGQGPYSALLQLLGLAFNPTASDPALVEIEQTPTL